MDDISSFNIQEPPSTNGSEIKTKLILLTALTFVFSGLLFGSVGFYLGTKQVAKTVPQSTPAPELSQAPFDSSVYDGGWFKIKQPENWKGLKSACQQITISQSDAIELETPINEYAQKTLGISDTDTYNKMIYATNANDKYKVFFPKLPNGEFVIAGPQGEDVLNQIFIRGPEGTGYLNILASYVGPAPDETGSCAGDVENEYKQVLSSFTVVQQ